MIRVGGFVHFTYVGWMSKGRVNSEGSKSTAARVLRQAGNSWARVERAAHRNENGVYVIRRRDLERDAHDPRNPPGERR